MAQKLPRIVIDNDGDLLEAIESQEEDEQVLEELAVKRKERRKSFLTVVNKKRLNPYELDEVML